MNVLDRINDAAQEAYLTDAEFPIKFFVDHDELKELYFQLDIEPDMDRLHISVDTIMSDFGLVELVRIT